MNLIVFTISAVLSHVLCLVASYGDNYYDHHQASKSEQNYAGNKDCSFYLPKQDEPDRPRASLLNPKARSYMLSYKEGFLNIKHKSFFKVTCREGRFVSISDQMESRIMVRCMRGPYVMFLGKEYNFQDVTCMEISNTLSILPGSNNTYTDSGKPPVLKTGMHSKVTTEDYGDFRVVILPSLSDNYMYLIVDKKTRLAAAVDPTSPEIIWDAVRREKAKLTHILTTHHHWDHAGSNKELVRGTTAYKLIVIGGDSRVDAVTHLMEEKEFTIKFGSIDIKCIRTPGHTVGHLIFYVNSLERGVVFTGDTLFVGGCGRFFEGNATDIYKALETISDLPDSTDMYCGHEYSIQNVKFSMLIDPENEELPKFLKKFEANRRAKIPNVPSTLGVEKRINPFMQTRDEKVVAFTRSNGDPVETLQLLRDIRDRTK